jgi:hypothetical protein
LTGKSGLSARLDYAGYAYYVTIVSSLTASDQY